jgi:hypothetical protein
VVSRQSRPPRPRRNQAHCGSSAQGWSEYWGCAGVTQLRNEGSGIRSSHKIARKFTSGVAARGRVAGFTSGRPGFGIQCWATGPRGCYVDARSACHALAYDASSIAPSARAARVTIAAAAIARLTMSTVPANNSVSNTKLIAVTCCKTLRAMIHCGT